MTICCRELGIGSGPLHSLHSLVASEAYLLAILFVPSSRLRPQGHIVLLTALLLVELTLLVRGRRLLVRVRRLSGRRTPHRELEGPLVGITQPAIPNRWATGGPPLVLLSHPTGMTPDEERSCTEDQLHLYLPKLGLDEDAHLSPPGKKKEAKEWRALQCKVGRFLLYSLPCGRTAFLVICHFASVVNCVAAWRDKSTLSVYNCGLRLI